MTALVPRVLQSRSTILPYFRSDDWVPPRGSPLDRDDRNHLIAPTNPRGWLFTAPSVIQPPLLTFVPPQDARVSVFFPDPWIALGVPHSTGDVGSDCFRGPPARRNLLFFSTFLLTSSQDPSHRQNSIRSGTPFFFWFTRSPSSFRQHFCSPEPSPSCHDPAHPPPGPSSTPHSAPLSRLFPLSTHPLAGPSEKVLPALLRKSLSCDSFITSPVLAQISLGTFSFSLALQVRLLVTNPPPFPYPPRPDLPGQYIWPFSSALPFPARDRAVIGTQKAFLQQKRGGFHSLQEGVSSTPKRGPGSFQLHHFFLRPALFFQRHRPPFHHSARSHFLRSQCTLMPRFAFFSPARP